LIPFQLCLNFQTIHAIASVILQLKRPKPLDPNGRGKGNLSCFAEAILNTKEGSCSGKEAFWEEEDGGRGLLCGVGGKTSV